MNLIRAPMTLGISGRGRLSPRRHAAAQGGPAALYFLDTFTDTDGTALDDHSPCWTVVSGTWVTSANKLKHSALSGVWRKVIVNASQSDVTVSNVQYRNSVYYMGQILRYVDEDNFLMWCTFGPQKYGLRKNDGGTYSWVASTAEGPSWTNLTAGSLKAILSGSNIQCIVDVGNGSVLVFDVNTSHVQTGSKFGLGVNNKTGVFFDDFLLEG